MAEQLLRDPDVEPTNEIIAESLDIANFTYIKFIEGLKNLNIDLEYRYYSDGKAWLGKGLYRWIGVRGGQKEITACWVSIFKGFFKVTIYIPERSRTEALSLALGGDIRRMIEDSVQMGKLRFFPLVFELRSDELLDQIYMLIDFRKNLE